MNHTKTEAAYYLFLLLLHYFQVKIPTIEKHPYFWSETPTPDVKNIDLKSSKSLAKQRILMSLSNSFLLRGIKASKEILQM